MGRECCVLLLWEGNGKELTDVASAGKEMDFLAFFPPFTLHPKIPRLFHCRNRFLGLTQSFLNIEGAKRCQNDRNNSAVIWYFHHHCVGFKLDEQS